MPFQRLGGSYSSIMHQEWRQAKGRVSVELEFPKSRIWYTDDPSQEWQKSFDEFQKKVASLPAGTLRPMAIYSYYYIAQSWVNLSEGKEMCYKLVGIFLGVYLMSALPALRQVAHRVFSHDPLSGRVSSLFTSQLGHASLLHLGVNSFALIGFGRWSVYGSIACV